MALRNWARGPFELLLHAEGHYRAGDDFDRRIALISFDNSVEVSITTYLTLNPALRGRRSCRREDVATWLNNYHTKLDFLENELSTRGLPWKVDREEIIWAHDQRNDQYHGGNKGTPEKRVLVAIREASLWVFSMLFDVPDPEAELDAELIATTPKVPVREPAVDRLIDSRYGTVTIVGQTYYTSEVLFGVDLAAYRAVAERCANGEADDDDI